MITLQDYYAGRDVEYAAELTNEVRANAFVTVTRVNLFLNSAGFTGRKCNSGWRPMAVNSATSGAAKKSKHIIGAAIDIEDKDGLLYKWAWDNHEHKKDRGLLAEIGLWVEDRKYTPTWTHFQIFGPPSGRRFFRAR